MLNVQHFFDPDTFTLTYVAQDPETRDAVIIDPVMDYDQLASTTSTDSVNKVIDFVKKNELNIHFILETHAHADHLSGSQALKEAFPEARLAIGRKITLVQDIFKGVFDLPEDFPTDGSQFDVLFDDNEEVTAGSLSFKVLYTPGHTPACASYYFEDAVFTGDALFMPDYGTGRCDFPAGSAEDLYHSITKRLYTLPDETRVFTCHDYQPNGRELMWESTIGEEKKSNIQLPGGRSQADYVEFRTSRDSGLKLPRLIFQSVQVNIDAGRLPKPGTNNVSYLKIPLDLPE
jgi:glyoxylase-like metal-dependent hydrolase (beta-lactamase superfamily II)